MEQGYRGCLEKLTRSVASGWVYLIGDPGARLTVELVLDGAVVGSAPVSLDRPHLAPLGIGRWDLGFDLPVPAGARLDIRRLAVRVAGTAHQLDVARDACKVEGFVERVGEGVAEGWVWRVGAPRERMAVALRLDGKAVAQGTAERHRQDLEGAGLGDGRYGFRLRYPEHLTSDLLEPGRLAVVVSETGEALVDLRPKKPQVAPAQAASPAPAPVQTEIAAPAPAIAPPVTKAAPVVQLAAFARPSDKTVTVSREVLEAMRMAVRFGDDKGTI